MPRSIEVGKSAKTAALPRVDSLVHGKGREVMRPFTTTLDLTAHAQVHDARKANPENLERVGQHRLLRQELQDDGFDVDQNSAW